VFIRRQPYFHPRRGAYHLVTAALRAARENDKMKPWRI
jgi:hypothetical protein